MSWRNDQSPGVFLSRMLEGDRLHLVEATAFGSGTYGRIGSAERGQALRKSGQLEKPRLIGFPIQSAKFPTPKDWAAGFISKIWSRESRTMSPSFMLRITTSWAMGRISRRRYRKML